MISFFSVFTLVVANKWGFMGLELPAKLKTYELSPDYETDKNLFVF